MALCLYFTVPWIWGSAMVWKHIYESKQCWLFYATSCGFSGTPLKPWAAPVLINSSAPIFPKKRLQIKIFVLVILPYPFNLISLPHCISPKTALLSGLWLQYWERLFQSAWWFEMHGTSWRMSDFSSDSEKLFFFLMTYLRYTPDLS